MKVYLNNKGYFNAEVTRKIDIKGSKATVEYQTFTTEPYQFGTITYSIKDDSIRYFVDQMQDGTLLKTGKQYDAYLMGDERERITRELKNLGYYAFLREYIFYEVDTSSDKRVADVKIIIRSVKNSAQGLNDSLTEVPHTRYYINNIYINTYATVIGFRRCIGKRYIILLQ